MRAWCVCVFSRGVFVLCAAVCMCAPRPYNDAVVFHENHRATWYGRVRIVCVCKRDCEWKRGGMGGEGGSVSGMRVSVCG